MDCGDAADFSSRPAGRVAGDGLRCAQRIRSHISKDPQVACAGGRGLAQGGCAAAAREEVGAVPQRGELVYVAGLRPGQVCGPGWTFCSLAWSPAFATRRVARMGHGAFRAIGRRWHQTIYYVQTCRTSCGRRGKISETSEHAGRMCAFDRNFGWLPANVSSAFMDIFISLPGRIPGWRRWRRRTPRLLITTG